MEFCFAREEETGFVLVVKFTEQRNSITDLLMPFVLDPYIHEQFYMLYSQKLVGAFLNYYFSTV